MISLYKPRTTFWVSGYWRWLEIVFWGEFGVVVGILVWVSTQVEAGKYTRLMYEQERYWYLTEAVIGPIVVATVFFILKQFVGTLIEGITEEDVGGSIYTALGLSFTLGLFLRRTLGIFDFIKDKVIARGIGKICLIKKGIQTGFLTSLR